MAGTRRVQGADDGAAADAQPPVQPAPADASARIAASEAGSASGAAEAGAQADAGAAAASAPAGARGQPGADAAASGAQGPGEQAGAGAARNPAEALKPAARARAAAEAALAAAKGAASGTAAAQHGKVTVTETRRFAGKEIQARAAVGNFSLGTSATTLCLHWLYCPWCRCRVTVAGAAKKNSPSPPPWTPSQQPVCALVLILSATAQMSRTVAEADLEAERAAKRKQAGLDAVLASLQAAKKVNVLDKSRADWSTFKRANTQARAWFLRIRRDMRHTGLVITTCTKRDRLSS